MRTLDHQCIRKRFAELAQLDFHAPAPRRHRRPPAQVQSRFMQVEEAPCNSMLGFDRDVMAKMAWLDQQLSQKRQQPQLHMEFGL